MINISKSVKSSDQLTSKLTRLLANLLVMSNITSKSTSKTDQNEPLMGAMGGAPPLPVPVPAWVRGIHSGEARTLGGQGRRQGSPWVQ